MCPILPALVLFGIFVCALLYFRRQVDRDAVRNVFVVVLGDIGRSPRMQYHSLSLAQSGYRVYIIGYGGSHPIEAVRKHESIHLVHLALVPSTIQRLPSILALLLKVLWQTASLTITLLFSARPSYILVQNPPSLPTMSVCYFVSLVRQSKLVFDWHNYGYTIFALSLGPQHPLVRLYRVYERFCGRLSCANICVTNAMKQDLFTNWNIRATTMHDRPPHIFRSLDLEEKHTMFQKLETILFRSKLESPWIASAVSGDVKELTRFTLKEANGTIRYRIDRPALLVSSTSWTGAEDEDFSILLKALDEYDTVEVGLKEDDNVPYLMCIITGKGPQKNYYLDLISKRKWNRVSIYTPWLEAADYPLLLACADLGVCLHNSSSGLDLPMKVVDMFGCCLPVCAVHFKCLDELVRDGENGLIFHSEMELAQQLQTLFRGFPHTECRQLKLFRENLKSFQQLRWEECWNGTVASIFS